MQFMDARPHLMVNHHPQSSHFVGVLSHGVHPGWQLHQLQTQSAHERPSHPTADGAVGSLSRIQHRGKRTRKQRIVDSG
jgi:hypothetical protein